MNQLKHPSAFGFRKGIEFSVTPSGRLRDVAVDSAARGGPGVYVAWLEPKGEALKVGAAATSVWDCWSGALRLMEACDGGEALCGDAWSDRAALVRAAAGQKVGVWWKTACRGRIDYAEEEGFAPVSLAEAEERFLNWYYHPVFGRLPADRGLPEILATD